ncbi:C4-dicarboxylate TRAP transporter large permease protein DctM (plasmid) [Pseudosulfitobacter pseudonitzschiae]|uniref:TRAP transporter large permease protein n=1 Tax=Pseudosulfitobacter pseudonitzschiae TaxID=1402135 RepID=A0A221K9D3_9RHOB|nr:TRAP transporter large permease subunit [Pseudosulfitobacter pseudonitzschiae]ASM75621.1 C4-dicarboxylate TRAP transporter large permease protein DctM [Pseudosulfitobacter pseudonitzschiae]
MDAGVISLLVLLLLVAFLASGTVIFVAIICVCTVSLTVFLGFDVNRLGSTLSRIMIRASSSWELSAIPLFVWMGEIVFRTSLISRMFQGLTPLVSRLPGGLLHTNVVGCALFAAVSGSSAATTATVGKITLGELRSRGYDEGLAVGSLAGAGTLGLLIPPSIVMIIYGLLAEVSIVRLFAAGLIPGLLIAALYSAFILARCVSRPEKAPRGGESAPLSAALRNLWPIAVLIFAVLGSIYSGLATPSESAAIGVLVTLVLAALHGELSLRLLRDSLLGAVPTACMICTILTAAAFLSTTMGFMHIPQDVAAIIGGMGLSSGGLLLILALFYILLGLLLDGISITVMTLPITLPLVLAAGIDPIWFGVFLVIMVELGQMTPPVGFNLFILQGMSGVPVLRVAAASLPFFLLMCLSVVILALLPDIALWLPRWIFG